MSKQYGRMFSGVLAAVSLAGCINVRVQDSKIGLENDMKQTPNGFFAFRTEVDGESWPAVVYVPAGYTPDKEWPLVVFLHGMGERGNDGWKQAEVGIGRAIRLNPDRFPAIVVMPQCSLDTTWGSAENPKGAPAWEHIDSTIAYVEKHYNVDKKRVSLTGLSMGGFGAYRYGAMRADEFSAFMPICGGGDPADAKELARRPLWAFHGLADTTVKPERSRQMVEAVKAAGGNAQLTEYEGIGHNSWDKAYGDPAAITWLLAQTL
jgi:predicted peptidase